VFETTLKGSVKRIKDIYVSRRTRTLRMVIEVEYLLANGSTLLLEERHDYEAFKNLPLHLAEGMFTLKAKQQ
jgi:hypothetical protein